MNKPNLCPTMGRSAGPVLVHDDARRSRIAAGRGVSGRASHFQLMRWHSPEGNRCALIVKRGSKFMHAVVVDSTVRLLRLPLTEERSMRELPKPTPQRAAKTMLASGRRLGITRSAKAALREVRA